MSVLAQVRRVAAMEAVPGRGTRQILGVVVFAAATALGAYVAVPLPGSPVMVTLQTLFVLLAGLLLGPWLGAASQAVYLAAGLMGAPIFAGGPGLAALAGPTGGYLMAFPAAAWLAGKLAGRVRAGGAGMGGVLRLTGAAVVADAVILLSGAAWLSILVGGMAQAVDLGVLPFLVGDALKLVLAVVVASGLRRRTLGPR
jgi:biotin transport system substrate-specific component